MISQYQDIETSMWPWQYIISFILFLSWSDNMCITVQFSLIIFWSYQRSTLSCNTVKLSIEKFLLLWWLQILHIIKSWLMLWYCSVCSHVIKLKLKYTQLFSNCYSEECFLRSFYNKLAWQLSWSCDLLPWPTEARYEIWL